MTQDQVFVPRTRSQFGLPPLNPDGENLLGSSIKTEVLKELQEAVGDSPIGALFGAASYLIGRSLVLPVRYLIIACSSSLVGPCI
jgi:omega-6 fatty acid desaturase (delta-12 desaturase)